MRPTALQKKGRRSGVGETTSRFSAAIKHAFNDQGRAAQIDEFLCRHMDSLKIYEIQKEEKSSDCSAANRRVGLNGGIRKPAIPTATMAKRFSPTTGTDQPAKKSGMIRAPMPKQKPSFKSKLPIRAVQQPSKSKLPAPNPIRPTSLPVRNAPSQIPAQRTTHLMPTPRIPQGERPPLHRGPLSLTPSYSPKSRIEMRSLTARSGASIWATMKSRLPPDTYETIRDDFSELQERVKKLTEQNSNYKNQLRDVEQENDRLAEAEARIVKLKSQNATLQSSVNQYNELVDRLNSQVARTNVNNEYLKRLNETLKRQLGEMEEKVCTANQEADHLRSKLEEESLKAKEEIERLQAAIEDQKQSRIAFEHEHEITVRKLHNEIVDLKGNVRIMVRLRKFVQHDGGAGDSVPETPVTVPNRRTIQMDAAGKTTSYEFPEVFGMNSSQEEVFESVKDLVMSALDGFSVCVIAYGQTGSGKTFTMRGGSGESAGIIPRTIKFLWSEQQRLLDIGWKYEFSVSFLEIYNDQVFDLLSARRDSLIPRIGNGSVQIPKLSEQQIIAADEVDMLLKVADNCRSTAATKCNASSSRSHAIFKLIIRGENTKTGETFQSELNLVDLAGSERVKESEAAGERFTEATYINKSLSALQNVLRCQLGKQSHVPYRDSKLTSVLQESLGKGSSKTLMIVNVAPTSKHAAETRRSLEFATQTSSVNIGAARKN